MPELGYTSDETTQIPSGPRVRPRPGRQTGRDIAPAEFDALAGLRVALVHDYLTQRGGAERVVLSMLRAFPEAPLYTSLYEPATTFPGFARADVRPLGLNRVAALRRDHRRALPLLAPAFRRLVVDADVVICSSSGWAHGANTRGRKIVYCYNPARWLYQTSQYQAQAGVARRAALAGLRPVLERADKSAAASASEYVAISQVVRRRIRDVYGRDSIVLHPPPALTPDGPMVPVDIEPGFLLCVSRLLPYKNVDVLVEAVRQRPAERLVVVGHGPAGQQLRAGAPPNVRFLGPVTDPVLRWLYANCKALVAASFEDFGLTPLEAATFGRPSIALRWGGFLETVVDGVTGVLFDEPKPASLAEALARFDALTWDPSTLRDHADRFSDDRFVSSIRRLVTGAPKRPVGGPAPVGTPEAELAHAVSPELSV
jgi:glycosyltransferase involved in cell wall biosynthesis